MARISRAARQCHNEPKSREAKRCLCGFQRKWDSKSQRQPFGCLSEEHQQLHLKLQLQGEGLALNREPFQCLWLQYRECGAADRNQLVALQLTQDARDRFSRRRRH